VAEVGVALKPLGDAFIKLIKLVIAPVIFCTVAGGIARMGDIKAFGRVGVKALLYFEVVSTVALVLGLIVGRTLQPGDGFNIDPKTLDPSIAAGYLAKAKHGEGLVEYLLHLIPDTFFGAFGGQPAAGAGDRHPDGLCLHAPGRLRRQGGQRAGGRRQAVLRHHPRGGAPGAAGRVRGHGLHHRQVRDRRLVQLGALVATFYITSLLFVLVVLGDDRLGQRLLDPALPGLYPRGAADRAGHQLVGIGAAADHGEAGERLGAKRSVVGLVIPTGYSFNLDGTNIYMTLATLFLAQATNTHMSLAQELALLGVAMLTSKGASGVTGAGFITLAATLAVVPDIPIAALAVLVGVDRFMSECRALTNLVGNGVATLVVARWEGALDRDRLTRVLRGETAPRRLPRADTEGE
jgi:aerobic C4-dicarboxylate transport protein